MKADNLGLRTNGLWREWLLNPATHLAGWPALWGGLLTIALTGIASYHARIRFDGVLDLHPGHSFFWSHLADGFIAWITLSTVLLIIARFACPTKFRALDLLGTQAFARAPMFLTAIIIWTLQLTAIEKDRMTFLIIIGLVGLPFLVWMVILMYSAFSISCNLKGGKAIALFSIGLFIAEVLSKLFIYMVPVLSQSK
jgi:hypothetical protein